MDQIIREYLVSSAEVKRSVADECVPSIIDAVGVLSKVFRSGGKLLICGNGGSAADSQHIAAEFISLLSKNHYRPAMPAIALTTDTSVITAFSNDFNFQGVFERQVQALAKPGDALIGISTSGNSSNVIRAVKAASQALASTIVLTGSTEGELSELADVVIKVPSTNTQHIQESHLAIEHIICHQVERALFPVPGSPQ